MIISRTPFRMSFVGGGTDLRAFYQKEDGKVLSAAIDKYVYVAVKRQLDIVDFKYRVGWSKTEFRNSIDTIEHPIVREALKLMEIDFPLEVTTFADVPANTGLGSSSAFAVGLLHALFALKGEMVKKSTLASMAAHIEVDILERNIGNGAFRKWRTRTFASAKPPSAFRSARIAEAARRIALLTSFAR